ncbi:RICIN domain-containing protein [Streptomyces mauvecolor]|uniref:RICIN domain-containing protein n=1 Tax=Streptomyces mauvecolor TaxID=58345 RepID=A0ABV9UR86_9ACTN
MNPRNRLAVLAAVLAATFAAITPGAGAAEPRARAESTLAVGPFQVRNQGTGRCMGMPAGDDRMRVWNCTTEAYQLWDLVPDGRGRYHMATRRDGRCLAGYARGPVGWATWLSNCDRGFTNEDQLWYVDPADSAGPGRIANLFGRVLEPDRGWGGANESPVVTHDNEDLPNQKWTLSYNP